MAENKEGTSQGDSSKDLSALKDLENFKAASLEDKEAYLEQTQNEVEEEQHDEASTESEEESSKDQDESTEASTSEDKSDETKDESDNSQSESTDKEKDESLVNQFTKLKKSYDSLQAEFTRRSQKNKKLEDELELIRNEIKREKTQSSVETSEFDKVMNQIREKNPDAAKLLELAKTQAVKEAKAEFDRELKALKSDVAKTQYQDNLRAFQNNLDEFLGSPLGELEPELMAIINEEFSDDEELLQAASQDPKLWKRLRRELLDRHLEKVTEAMNKKKSKKSSVSQEQRDQEIQNAKGSGKSSTSKKTTDSDSVKYFEKLSLEEKEKYLKKRGLFT